MGLKLLRPWYCENWKPIWEMFNGMRWWAKDNWIFQQTSENIVANRRKLSGSSEKLHLTNAPKQTSLFSCTDLPLYRSSKNVIENPALSLLAVTYKLLSRTLSFSVVLFSSDKCVFHVHRKVMKHNGRIWGEQKPS